MSPTNPSFWLPPPPQSCLLGLMRQGCLQGCGCGRAQRERVRGLSPHPRAQRPNSGRGDRNHPLRARSPALPCPQAHPRPEAGKNTRLAEATADSSPGALTAILTSERRAGFWVNYRAPASREERAHSRDPRGALCVCAMRMRSGRPVT